MVPVLPVNVLLVTVAVAVRLWLKMPPPSCPEFPLNVLKVTVSGPLLLIAPPEVPVVAGAEFPVNLPDVTDRAPRLKMAPPPSVPLSARPFRNVSERSVRRPAEATSNMRKAAVAVPERAMVAPLPWTVTLPVMTGRPVPPSVGLFAVARV